MGLTGRRAAVVVVLAAALGLVSCGGGGGPSDIDDIERVTGAGRWDPIPAAPLEARIFPANVWTGKELLVLGGRTCTVGRCEDESVPPFADGAAYDPGANTWRPLPASPLAPRTRASVLWTGREMLLWGGDGPNEQALADGAAYDPAADTWRPIAASPLSSRTFRTIWTGTEMLAWGSQAGTDDRVDGAAYDPATDAWRPLAASPLTARTLPAGEWTGTEVLLWGGQADEADAVDPADQPYLADGAAYNPTTDTWRPMAASPLAPRATRGFWTGTALLVWGGEGPNAAFDDGASYDPATDRWQPMPAAPVVARRGFAAAWTGSEMIVWGGAAATGPSFFGNGAIYDPARGRWRRMVPSAPRFIPNVHWTGSQLLVWGGLVLPLGSSAVEPANDGALFTP